MASSRKVQNTHISNDQLRNLHGAVLDIVAVINAPQRDEVLIRKAGIRLDRALFPPLVLIERLGPIGIGALADRIGRDYTTVSRQVSRLEELDLAARRAHDGDRRVSDVVVTAKGKAMCVRLDEARARLGRAIFADWKMQEIDDLVRLMRKFADAVQEKPSTTA